MKRDIESMKELLRWYYGNKGRQYQITTVGAIVKLTLQECNKFGEHEYDCTIEADWLCVAIDNALLDYSENFLKLTPREQPPK